jgi:hypothetical protein
MRSMTIAATMACCSKSTFSKFVNIIETVNGAVAAGEDVRKVLAAMTKASLDKKRGGAMKGCTKLEPEHLKHNHNIFRDPNKENSSSPSLFFCSATSPATDTTKIGKPIDRFVVRTVLNKKSPSITPVTGRLTECVVVENWHYPFFGCLPFKGSHRPHPNVRRNLTTFP